MPDRSGDLPVSMGNVKVRRETEKAILVDIGGQEIWIPQSAVHDDSEAWKYGDCGKLVVCTWFARKKGWVD
jgi:hypothetical protein